VSSQKLVRIVDFPATRVAVAEHLGPPELEYETSRRLIDWRICNGLPPKMHRTYGVHYTDPHSTPPTEHRVDFCVSYDKEVEPNSQGIVNKVIPANRCALARHIGSRSRNGAAIYLFREWLPKSGEETAAFPMFFHYLNVGPDVQEHEMITDVFLPLKFRDSQTLV